MSEVKGFDNIAIACNSSGLQFMHAVRDEESSIRFVITGSYDDQDIQLDFDSLSGLELKHFIEKLQELSK